MMEEPRDEYWMQHALVLAQAAHQAGEVPIGAVLVREEKIIGEGGNAPISHADPTAHAEMIALRQAAKQIENYRLLDTTLYVTLEPCLMCVGAMVHARIKRVVFGALDPKAGAVVSKIGALDYSFLNHRVKYEGGVLALPCAEILKQFFKEKRLLHKE